MQSVIETTTMQVDEKGRIVLPQAVREQMCIVPGTTLLMQVANDGEIRLRVAPEAIPIVNKGGLLVITSEAIGDIEGAVERDREDRIQSFLQGIKPIVRA